MLDFTSRTIKGVMAMTNVGHSCTLSKMYCTSLLRDIHRYDRYNFMVFVQGSEVQVLFATSHIAVRKCVYESKRVKTCVTSLGYI